MRASPTAVPLTVAQRTASQTSTSGSAGFAGGFLPVAAFHEVFRPFFAIAAAARAATSERMLHDFELPFFFFLSLAMSLPFTGHSWEYPSNLVRTGCVSGAEG